MNKTVEPKEKKVIKNGKIKIDFERTSWFERFRIKYLSFFFAKKLVWYIFRLALMIGISYVIIFPFISKIAGSFMSPDDFVDVSVKLIPKYLHYSFLISLAYQLNSLAGVPLSSARKL